MFRALGLVNVAVGASYAVARVFSSLFNYFLNRKIFESRGSVKKTLIRYYLLAACILAVGSLTTAVLTNVVGAIPGVANALGGMDVNEAGTLISTLIKLPVDLILFVVSYTVQKKYVFKKES